MGKLPAEVKQIVQTACREWCWENVERITLRTSRSPKKPKARGYAGELEQGRHLAIRAEAKRSGQIGRTRAQTKKVIEAQEEF
jgi:hypothetical protein